MGAVVEQIQQTYDLQVNGYYSQLHLLEDSLIQEEVRSIEPVSYTHLTLPTKRIV